ERFHSDSKAIEELIEGRAITPLGPLDKKLIRLRHDPLHLTLYSPLGPGSGRRIFMEPGDFAAHCTPSCEPGRRTTASGRRRYRHQWWLALVGRQACPDGHRRWRASLLSRT